MEASPESTERIAPIDLDTYLASLPTLYEVDGKVLEDQNIYGHLFYHWVTVTYPQFHDVDGTSLEDLYVKNVSENDMSLTDFYTYCDHSKPRFPVPAPTEREENSYYLYNYRKYIDELLLLHDQEYEIWAHEHGIDTRPGAVMVFIDSEGSRNRVHTETKKRGQLIID